MIQELLGSSGGGGLFGGERKISINGGELEGTPSSTITPTTTTTPTTTSNGAQNNQENNQSLRCPRCDSSNTKFCYYNNYNLTQPRHFCKTCRRYWTKGGALRNVPIGGGCRKNKNNCISTPLGKSNVGNLPKTAIGLGLNHHHQMFGHDHFGSNNTNNPNAIWASSPQNSHILALLKASQNPNPSPGGLFSDGSKMIMNDSSVNTGAFNALTLGLDPYSQVPPLPFWRNNQHQLENHQHQNGLGIQEMYQKMKTSNNYYATNDDHHDQGVMGNFGGATTSTSSSSILESAPVGSGSELRYNWTSAYSTWSELPAANGSYP